MNIHHRAIRPQYSAGTGISELAIYSGEDPWDALSCIRIPYCHRSFSVKEPLNWWSFHENSWLIYGKQRTCGKNLT